MFRKSAQLALVIAAFLGTTGTLWADIVIDVPFFFLRIGPKGQIAVAVPGPIPVPEQPARPAQPEKRAAEEPSTEPLVVPPTAPAQVLPPPRPDEGGAPIEKPRPPTHGEFARSFQPQEGLYEVLLTHPHTGQPVLVRFRLPPGLPKTVRIEKNELEFDYGNFEVEIRFRRSGAVSVEYND